jgi:enamine deaminase RidA (YjgF/YER057c/UK114 family)
MTAARKGGGGEGSGGGGVHRLLRPPGWPKPKGYAYGVLAEGRLVFTGGLVGWDEEGRFAESFAGQFRQTLHNIVTVLGEAGAGPRHIVRMTWYVTDIAAYLGSLKDVGAAWREIMGLVYPPMAVVEVRRLVEKDALLEIETTAVIPYPEAAP